jgi:hypothetical protein
VLAAAIAGKTRDAAWAKKRKPKLKRNQFGCVDVGGKCRGKDSNCCSGICDGAKPKKGQKDKSRCRAHDTGTLVGAARGCSAADDSCGPAGNTACTTSLAEDGFCHKTTGNAGYCALDAECFDCTTDEECVPICGEGAACILCPPPGSTCVATGGRQCAGFRDCIVP